MFIWQEKYNLGDEMIDAQHRQLFDLANQIVQATEIDEVTRLLMLFYQHVREHFQLEENYMKQIHYADVIEHTERHNQMLDKLIEISEKVHAKKWNTEDMKNFVNSWVLIHVLQDDLKLDRKLKQNS